MTDPVASAFLSTLVTEEKDEHEGTWSVYVPLVYRSALLGLTLTVPTGFVTDYASVPRIPIVYEGAGNKCQKAAVVHDWLYSTECVDRATADRVLREAILASGYGWFTADAFYAAVREFGAGHWALPNQPQTPVVEALMATMRTTRSNAHV